MRGNMNYSHEMDSEQVRNTFRTLQTEPSANKLIYFHISQRLMQWELVGFIAGLLTMFGPVPQIYKMLKTKSVDDISLPSYLQGTLGIFLWLIYSLHIQDTPMILSNTITFISFAAIILIHLKYRTVK
jgi:MtN3 and saliva related transmembrane protein